MLAPLLHTYLKVPHWDIDCGVVISKIMVTILGESFVPWLDRWYCQTLKFWIVMLTLERMVTILGESFVLRIPVIG